MNILAIDTTSAAASAAIINEEKLLGTYTCNAKLTHLQKLIPMIEHLMVNCELSRDDLTHVAVSEGPGSFTGIRIGVSTAKALAQIKHLPMVSVPTLKSMAYNIPFYQGIVCPILDARRQQVYGAAYQWQNKQCYEIIPPGAYDIVELITKINRYEDILFLGDGMDTYKEIIVNHMGSKADFAPQYLKMQNAASVARLAYEMVSIGQQKNYLEVKPTYLRKAEAERKLEEKKREQI